MEENNLIVIFLRSACIIGKSKIVGYDELGTWVG